MNGIVLIDKPLKWTSFDVVAKVRGILKSGFGKKVKVGHAGTLDPLATGLLIILIGDACKQADRFLKLDKAYDAEITLGQTSTTDDAEGELATGGLVKQPNEPEIEQVLAKFVGEISQTPPAYSAIKVNGKRAYKSARAGKKIELKARTVNIYECNLKLYKYPVLQIETSVSSGTYIRSLARDIGLELGTGAYLSGLRRMQISKYQISDAIKINHLDPETIKKNIKPVQS